MLALQEIDLEAIYFNNWLWLWLFVGLVAHGSGATDQIVDMVVWLFKRIRKVRV